MRTVTKRELNQHTAGVLKQVGNEDVVVTERGKARWRVSAIRDHDTTLTRLEREGRYTPPSEEPSPWPAHPGGPTYSPAEADALIEDARGDH